MGTERKHVHDVDGWMRNQERMANQQARRRVPQTASDLLGPGFGPTATLLYDWNAEEASFNGMFWSAIGAINSPDSSVEWCGLSIVEDERLHGVQIIWTTRDGSPPRQLRRRFDSTDGVLRVYTPWLGDTDWVTTGFTALSGPGYTAPTLSQTCWRRDGSTASVNCTLTLTTAIASTANGNLANAPMVQLPAEIAPTDCPFGQGLRSSDGPLASWWVTSDAVVSLTAVGPGVDLPVGSVLTFSGTYLI